VAVSTGIACFGLISNSTAVVIGAMLVAPLMTPIFGISFALVRGDGPLLGRAIRAEVVGVAVAVAMGFALGLMLPGLEATPEMLSRTRPNLFDLFVAILAGFAGSYALIDEKISPALPGVAIATAIVPPLANSGLCLALGAIEGGIGSFLLFFANFLSILLVASVTFIVSGMAKDYGSGISRKDFFRRFGLAIFGFVMVAAFLSHSLIEIMRQRQAQMALETAVYTELADIPAAGLDKMFTDEGDEYLHVFLQVHTPRALSPNQVKRLQDKMTEGVGRPVELLVRSILSRDVSAMGHTNEAVAQDLDGKFLARSENPTVQKIAIVEQILREYFLSRIGLYLDEIEFLPLSSHPVMLAAVAGMRRLTTDEIIELTSKIRLKSGDDDLELVVRYLPMDLYDREGKLRYGWWAMEDETPETVMLITQMRAFLDRAFQTDADFHLVHTNATHLDGRFHFLLEVVGAGIYPREEVARLKKRLVDKYGQAVDLFVLSRPEVVVTPDRLLPLYKVNEYYVGKQEKQMREEIARMLETAIY
jgi:uncharacterized hydrophobic protein (TIGR00271 family)